jgi:hypothetical protein
MTNVEFVESRAGWPPDSGRLPRSGQDSVLHACDTVQDRSAQLVAAAETVASWARARRAVWSDAPAVVDSAALPSETPAPGEAADEPVLSVSEMLSSLVSSADFRKTLD